MAGIDDLKPLTADDSSIEAALEAAHIPSLMLALVHLTGRLDHLRGDIRPHMAFMSPDDGISDEQAASVRAMALDALKAYRDNPVLPASPSQVDIREMVSFMTGQEMSEDYVEFLLEELSLQGEDAMGQPKIFEVPEAKRATFKVIVIGAGMSGILAGIRLQEAGIGFEIIEKNTDVGGTWYENTYPGCRVDSANHVYSYSFKPQDWPQHFSERRVLHEYFSSCADEYGLRERTRFNTEVTSATFDESSGQWQVAIRSPDGGTETLQANAVISAVGQLNRPNVPDIDGRDRFHGESFHSAQWRHDIDLSGKRVGVIGSGASAFQFVPIIADEAADVTVFQRTAPWVLPNPEYFEEVPSGAHWLFSHVPFYAKWFRFSVFWRGAEGLLSAVEVEDGWNRPEHSVGAANAELRAALEANLKEVFADDEELLTKCTPNYPPGAKRALVDDGRWLNSLKRDDVHLLTDPIAEITERGISTKDGTEHEFDVIIYATGFKANQFLFPMKIYGKNGAELHEQWGDEPRAYKGVTVPGFPNLFCCYGPNTNIVINGSIVFFSECEIRYVLGCLALLLEKDQPSLEVKPDVHDAYNKRIDAGNAAKAWGQSSVSTWYKNKHGHITQNWPFSMLEFWQQMREADESDYIFG